VLLSEKGGFLRLEPRVLSLNETVTCTLKHVKLSDKPQCEALSYEWEKKEVKRISLNGKEREIRENLFDALSNF
jgi:hypothetical protein